MIKYLMISPNFPDTYYKFAKSLKERGVSVIGLGDAFPNELKPALVNNLTEYIQRYNFRDMPLLIKDVDRIIKKYNGIDYIESNNEYWLETDSILREWFNISSGIYHSNINKYKLKSEMKKYFLKGDVKVAEYHLSDNFEKTLHFANKVGFPIFVKPNNGVGASDVWRINDMEDLKVFYDTKDSKKYIFERFIDGDIYSFDGITNSKGEIIFKVAERFLVLNDEIMNQGSDDCYFCYDKIPMELNDIGIRTVKAFDIKSRCFHIEFFRLNKDHEGLGKEGEFIGLEVNMRPPGGYTPDLISFASGVSFYDVYADMIVYDENRQIPKDIQFSVTASRRDNFQYKYSNDDILYKYENNIKKYGTYPESIRDDMGDTYYMAIFKTLEEVYEFENYVRSKV